MRRVWTSAVSGGAMTAIVTARVTLTFDDEFLSNLLITAFDGQYGSSWFWAEAVGKDWLTEVVGDDELLWKSCHIIEKEPHTENARRKSAVIDHNALGRGIMLLLQHEGYTNLKIALLERDSGQIDANGADTIMQFTVFGEEVYG